MTAYSAEYWYRHESDPDTAQRDGCQMSGPAPEGEESVLSEIARLETQGFHVQQANLLTTCEACQGAGRIGRRRKGARKDSRGQWAQTWTTCQVCGGAGSTASQRIR
jgi:hypothetical protein